jgi:hypothetical protein
VADRIILQYANTKREVGLSAIPETLRTLLGQIADRIILQYANTNRQIGLSYPVALIGDTAPPQISGITATPVGSSIVISWTTDEFATSVVLYGTQPGVYTRTVNDPLYVKQHEVTLTGLAPRTTYYFIVRSADRSGNVAESGEYRFTTTSPAYLPLIQRR